MTDLTAEALASHPIGVNARVFISGIEGINAPRVVSPSSSAVAVCQIPPPSEDNLPLAHLHFGCRQAETLLGFRLKL